MVNGHHGYSSTPWKAHPVPGFSPELEAVYVYEAVPGSFPLFNRRDSVSFSVSSSRALAAQLRRRTWFDRLGLWTGLARETAATSTNCTSYYAVTEQVAAMSLLLQDASVKSAFDRLVNLSIVEVTWSAKSAPAISVRRDGCKPQDVAFPELARTVTECLCDLQRASARLPLDTLGIVTPHPSAVRCGTLWTWAICLLSILLLLLPGVVVGNIEQLSLEDSSSKALWWWGPFVVANAVLLWAWFRGSSGGHSRFLVSMLFILPLSFIAANSTHRSLNTALDFSDVREERFNIEDASITYSVGPKAMPSILHPIPEIVAHERGAVHATPINAKPKVLCPRLPVESVRALCRQPTQNVLVVEYSPGLLGIPWLRGWHVESDPSYPKIKVQIDPKPNI